MLRIITSQTYLRSSVMWVERYSALHVLGHSSDFFWKTSHRLKTCAARGGAALLWSYRIYILILPLSLWLLCTSRLTLNHSWLHFDFTALLRLQWFTCAVANWLACFKPSNVSTVGVFPSFLRWVWWFLSSPWSLHLPLSWWLSWRCTTHALRSDSS